MGEPSQSLLYAVRRLSSFLFISLLLLATLFLSKVPLAYFSLSALLVLVGLPLFTYGLVTGERYKNVFDYEPTQFLGQNKNGSQVRDILMTANVVGLWCTLSGLALT